MKYMYFKKSLSFLIALMLLVGLLPMSALNVLAAGETVVYTVGVGDLAEPTVAEWPSNELTVRGRGFSLDTSVNKYETIYTGDYTAMQKYYVLNGVGFYNKTTKTWLDYNHTFEYGYTYVAYVYLKANDGYSFNTGDMTAKINGKDATVIYDEKEPTKKICITAEFYCDVTNVSLIMLYDVEAPVAGQTPADYSVTLAYPDYYTFAEGRTGYVNGIRWVDESGKDMRANSTFKEGVEYRLQMAIVPAQKYGENLCSFDYSISAMIDGVMVESPGANGWDEVYWASSSLVYIYYTLPAAVAAPVVPEPEPPVVEDTVIHSVDISDVSYPDAFSIPEYSATVPNGENYGVFEEASYYGCINNGIIWHNTTDNVMVNPEHNTTIVPGNTYTALVFLEAAEGYTFDMENLSCTVNGEAADWYLVGDNPRYIGVYRSFTVSTYKVAAFDLWIETPVAGNAPAFYATTDDLSYYPNSYGDNFSGIVWEDLTDGYEGTLSRGDIFLAGHEYRVSICVSAARGCYLATDRKGYSDVYAEVNGDMASIVGSDMFSADKTVFVIYDFVVEGEVFEPEVGDINSDGSVNSLDSNLLSRLIAGLDMSSFGDEVERLADINGDGSVNAIDSNIFKRMLAGI